MTADEADKIVTQLSSITERELIEVLTRVFDVYAVRFDATEERGSRYALIRSLWEKGFDDDEPYIEVLGVPSGPYRLAPNDEALDNGECPTCHVVVGCADQLAKCPICGTTGVECT